MLERHCTPEGRKAAADDRRKWKTPKELREEENPPWRLEEEYPLADNQAVHQEPQDDVPTMSGHVRQISSAQEAIERELNQRRQLVRETEGSEACAHHEFHYREAEARLHRLLAAQGDVPTVSGRAPSDTLPDLRTIDKIKVQFDRVWHRAASTGAPHLTTAWRSSNARELERANEDFWKCIREMRDQHRWKSDGIKCVLDQDLPADQREVFPNHVDAALLTADYEKVRCRCSRFEILWCFFCPRVLLTG